MDIKSTIPELYSQINAHPYLAAIGICLCYQVGRAIYRIYFHPLANFPGPKLAAASRWYEFYFEILRGGKWLHQIEKMHKHYGPIVRINPFELHVNDPEYWSTLYNFNPQLDKRFYWEHDLQQTQKHEAHKKVRNVLSPFFSRQSIMKLEWLIKEEFEKLCTRLEGHRQSQEPANMSLLFRCLSADIISEYCLSQSFNFLDRPDKADTFFATYSLGFKSFFLFREVPYFAVIAKGISKLPSCFLPGVDSSLPAFAWSQDGRGRVRALMKGEVDISNTSHPTVFHEFLQNKLPSSDKTEDRLFDEGRTFIGAGYETTAHTLITATYHILANPQIHHRFKEELTAIWPSDDTIPSWTTLEKLPFFHAILQETLRMATGVTGRLSRVNNETSMRYREWEIPKGTAIGMSQPLTHFNGELFPDPWSFDPERWLKGEESRELEKYVNPFSGGSRGCIAQNLAKAELCLTLATSFYRFDMELFETSRKDVDISRDYFLAGIEPGRKGVRVLIK